MSADVAHRIPDGLVEQVAGVGGLQPGERELLLQRRRDAIRPPADRLAFGLATHTATTTTTRRTP